MIHLENVELTSLANAKVGEFLFASDSPDRSIAILKEKTADGPCYVVAIKPEKEGEVAKEVARYSYADMFLYYTNTRIMVDPDSVVHGTRCSPALGTLLLTVKGPGILFKSYGGHEAVLLLTGETVNADWGRDTGYCRWEVEALDEEHSPTSLLKVDVPPPSKN
jgi:hypothetical protein